MIMTKLSTKQLVKLGKLKIEYMIQINSTNRELEFASEFTENYVHFLKARKSAFNHFIDIVTQLIEGSKKLSDIVADTKPLLMSIPSEMNTLNKNEWMYHFSKGKLEAVKIFYKDIKNI